jgi:hypothetical protein
MLNFKKGATMKQMTLLEQVLDIKPKVIFNSYFKYSFTLIGKTTLSNGDEISITASMGGSADDIYRLSISANSEEILAKEHFNSITVKNVNTGEEESWNDY